MNRREFIATSAAAPLAAPAAVHANGTLATLYAEWRRLCDAYLDPEIDDEADVIGHAMDEIEIAMQDIPCRTPRDIAYKIAPYTINIDREPNFTGVIDELMALIDQQAVDTWEREKAERGIA